MLEADAQSAKHSAKQTDSPEAVSASPQRAILAPTVRAGRKLAMAREAMGLTQEQAGARLRLQPEWIAALEDMNMNALPGKAYARAYLRSYSALLQLPVETLVTQYEGECARLREDLEEPIRNPDSKPRPERPWLAAAALAIVAAGFVGWQALHDKAAPESNPAQPQDVAANSGGPIAPSAPMAPGAEDPWGLTAQVVEIEAIAPAWLEVRGPDGTIFYNKTMKPGDRYKPDVGGGWTLHAQDGHAFKVVLNGVDIGALGEPQSPVLGRKVDAIAATAVAPAAELPVKPPTGAAG